MRPDVPQKCKVYYVLQVDLIIFFLLFHQNLFFWCLLFLLFSICLMLSFVIFVCIQNL
jgi:hypothetical protein